MHVHVTTASDHFMRHLATDPTLNQPVENPEPPRDTTDWEDCTPLGDRGVLKRVIRSGNADAGVPIDGWCAKVNFDAYIEGAGSMGARSIRHATAPMRTVIINSSSATRMRQSPAAG